MLISRGVNVVRNLKLLQRNSNISSIVRNGHEWNYRVGPAPPPKSIMIAAEVVAGVAWWWILWHLWTEPGHVFGEFEYPDASKWTDEELGIPADD